MSDQEKPNPDMCAAPACPMLGAITDSTQGDSRWLCHLHHAQPPSRWARISACLHEHVWLAGNLVALRQSRWGEGFAHTVRTARRAFSEHGRDELHNVRGESFERWMRRLNEALTAAVVAKLGTGGAAYTSRGGDTWCRVSFDLPEPEEEAA
jgi:hypothetical protein